MLIACSAGRLCSFGGGAALQRCLFHQHGDDPALIQKRTKAYTMTYQTASENFAAQIPARGMSITSAPFMSARTGLAQLADIFRSIGASIMRATEASSRFHRIEALQAKSDAELASIGIKRDDIVHHVFRDLYYT